MKKITLLCLLFIIIIFTVILLPIKWVVAEAPSLPPEVIDVSKGDIVAYAYDQVVEAFGRSEWEAFNAIVIKESNWTVTTAHYPVKKTSSAHGLCGFLNQTWVDTGFVKTDDPHTQVDACIVYVQQRYETPQRALAFHKRMNWF